MSAAPVDLRAQFAALARDVGADSARPLRDGSLLLEWGATEGRKALRWSPRNDGPGTGRRGLRGRLATRSFTAPALDAAAAKLGSVYKHYNVQGVNPFEFSGLQGSVIALSPQRLHEALGSFLVPNVTHWGPLTYAGARTLDSAVALDFNGPGYGVSFFLQPAPPEPAEGLVALGPVALGLLNDSRPDSLRGSPELDIESYLLYALQRTVALGASAAVVADAPVAPAPDQGGDQLESLLVDPSAQEYGCKELLSSCLAAADDGASFVIHAANECTRHYRFVRSNKAFQNNSIRLQAMPIAIPGRHARIVEMDEIEAVMGNDSRVRTALREASGDPSGSLIVGETCVADCIGMPIDGIAEEETEHSDKNITFVRITMDETTPIARLWSSLFRVADREVPTEPGLINLVGFGPSRSEFADELGALLRAAKLRINGMFVPSFDSSAARRALAAQCTIVNVCTRTALEFEEAAAAFAGVPHLQVEPPFGPRATTRFVGEIARACAVPAPSAALESAWAGCQSTWQAFRRRAGAHEAAIVATPGDVRVLLAPRELFGLDLVSVLAEMGFRVRVVLRAPAGDIESQLRARLDTQGVDHAGVVVETVPADRPVTHLLRALPSSLVYSVYTSDRRVWEAGKVPFRAAQFEYGYAGALRTISRLVRLAECRFSKAVGGVASLP